MIHREIQGVRVPALGFGTFRLPGDVAREGVEHALAMGLRHIDTARAYGNEADVGRALRASGVPRDEIFLVTKVPPNEFRAIDAIACARASLRDLGVEYVDLLLLHWPNPDVPVEETLEALATLRDEGAVRHLGVSNFPPSLVERAARSQTIFTNQVEYHPYLGQRALLEQCEAKDMLLTAYSPLAQGKIADDPTLREIGEAHGKNAAQVALRWLLQQPRVAAIPRSSNRERREANADVFDFELSDEEMRRVDALDREWRLVNPAHAPDWER